MRKSLLVALTLAAVGCFDCLAAKADGERRNTASLVKLSDAEKLLFPDGDFTEGWGRHQIRRGGKFYFFASDAKCDADGNRVWTNWEQYSCNLVGTIVAVPIGDFVVETAFAYRNSPSATSCLTGAVVSVEVQLSSGSKMPTEMVLHNTVKNLACNGMSIANTNGGKPARLMALKKSACRRFGGKNPKVHYDARRGKVYVLMEDCRPENADSTFVPATPEGASKTDRAKLAKLYRESDKGGTSVLIVNRVIRPIGISKIVDAAPADDNGL